MSSKPNSEPESLETAEPILSLHEHCIRLSVDDRRVELIAAFESAERAAGRLRDTASAYAERYQAFINKPA